MPPEALIEQSTSAAEIASLFALYDVARSDATVQGLSADGRYVHAYTAGFLLAKIAIRSAGYRVRGGENHRDTLLSLPWVMGSQCDRFARLMQPARTRRSTALYDAAGGVDDEDIDDLLAEIRDFEIILRSWLSEGHPELLAPACAGER